jgi:hypothetical protein
MGIGQSISTVITCNVYHEPSSGLYFYMRGWMGSGASANLQSAWGFPRRIRQTVQHMPNKQYPKEKYKPGKVAKK